MMGSKKCADPILSILIHWNILCIFVHTQHFTLKKSSSMSCDNIRTRVKLCNVLLRWLSWLLLLLLLYLTFSFWHWTFSFHLKNYLDTSYFTLLCTGASTDLDRQYICLLTRFMTPPPPSVSLSSLNSYLCKHRTSNSWQTSSEAIYSWVDQGGRIYYYGSIHIHGHHLS